MKRIILSFNEDDCELLKFVITAHIANMPKAPESTTPGLSLARLRSQLEKIHKKLEVKHE